MFNFLLPDVHKHVFSHAHVWCSSCLNLVRRAYVRTYIMVAAFQADMDGEKDNPIEISSGEEDIEQR